MAPVSVAAGVDAEQGLQALAIVGQHDRPAIGRGAQILQGGRGEPGQVHRAEQQALVGMVRHQPRQRPQRTLPGGRFVECLDRQLLAERQRLRQLPVLPVAAQQGHRHPLGRQQGEGALQPAAPLRMGQQGLVAPHPPAGATAE